MKRLTGNPPTPFGFEKASSARATAKTVGEKKVSMAVTKSSPTPSHCPVSAAAASGRSSTVSTLTARRGSDSRATALASAMAMVIAVAVVSAMAAMAGPAQGAVGDNFSFAPVTTDTPSTTAPAFPAGPDARAWWAGACDLADGAFAVGDDPGTPFPSCIEQPPSTRQPGELAETAVFAPLAPGVPTGTSGLDTGWIGGAPGWRLADVTQAGAHPDGSASFWFSRSPDATEGQNPWVWAPDGSPRNVVVSLPPGVVGNPNAIPKCPASALRTVPTTCPPKTQIGVSTIMANSAVAVVPVYNVEARVGKTAELIVSGAGHGATLTSNVPVIASARTEGDFGIDAAAVQIPAGLAVQAQTFTIWGVPWSSQHDRYRPVKGYCGATAGDGTNAFQTPGMRVTGLPGGTGRGCSQAGVSYDPSWGPVRPFLSTQTECSSRNPVTTIFADNWHTEVTDTRHSAAPLVDGCEKLRFPVTFALQATSRAADAAAGIEVDLAIPQNNDPPHEKRFNANANDPDSAVAHWKSTAGLATAHLKDAVVTLPDGFSANPSSATGLAGCSDGAIGVTNAASNPMVFNNGDPFDKDGGADGAECPDGSIIGTAEITTPLLDEELTGEVVLGEPKSTDPTSGQMLRMFIVVRNRERALLAKVYGSATADPDSGQLSAKFENNPQVPFESLKLRLKGGAKGLLATAQRCATGPDDYRSVSSFVPWSRAHLPAGDGPGAQDPVGIVQGWVVDQNCAYAFNPGLKAGMSNARAREGGAFSFEFTRPQGDQVLKGLTAELPTGLLASVRDLPLCANAQADAGDCPAESRIGSVDASAGSGDPFVLEQKGEIFLTEGYRGGPYGLMVKVRAIAGPFRGAMELSPIVVRQKIEVDPRTAQVRAISDPFPTIWHGVPLRVRRVLVKVDRPSFMLNPSDCASKEVGASFMSAEGATHDTANPFIASGCAALAFEPKLTMRLTGRRQTRTGRHPGIRAQVTQEGVSEAGIEKAVVRLPRSLALDVNNAQALCEYVDGTKPDLENHCPRGSIIGRARAVSPLLNEPLVGDVYFVKNVRRDPKTGNEIRTLPMVIAALRGEIAINLRGESSVDGRDRLVSTFQTVPDAPVTRFNMNIDGGRNGIIAVTRTRRALIDLCAKPRGHVAEADMDGHNGKRHDRDIRMRTPCTKRQVKQAKRAAKRAARQAAARRAARRR